MAFGVWEIALVGSGPDSQAIVNTFHYVSSGDEAAGVEIALQLVADFKLTVLPPFLLAVTLDWHGFSISAVCLAGPNQGQEYTENIAGQNGAKALASAPLQSTAIVKRKSDAIGRHSRGRLYISPVQEADTDVNGRYDDSDGSMANLALAVKDNITTLEQAYDPCLVDKPAGGVVGFSKLIATSVSPLVGVMRSRRVRFPN